MGQGRPQKSNTSGNIRERIRVAEVAPRTDDRVRKRVISLLETVIRTMTSSLNPPSLCFPPAVFWLAVRSVT
jgi:hypothetical protein